MHSPPSLRPSGGTAIENLILLAMAVAILTSVVVIIGRLLVRRQRAREEWEKNGRPEAPEKTSEEKAKERQTGVIWGCLIVAVPVALVLLYTVTR
ncbi:hypothetical protein GCM10023160_22520 [Brachybacterium paraconglomeratum]